MRKRIIDWYLRRYNTKKYCLKYPHLKQVENGTILEMGQMLTIQSKIHNWFEYDEIQPHSTIFKYHRVVKFDEVKNGKFIAATEEEIAIAEAKRALCLE